MAFAQAGGFKVKIRCHNWLKFYNPKLDTFKCRALNFFTNRRASVVVEDHVNNSKVTEVFFDKSQMYEVPSDLFIKYTNLIVLKATDAKLQIISNTTFVYGENLMELNLNDNQVKALEEGFFQQLHNLTTLSLHNNLIERVSEGAFFGLESLVKLDLGENKIDHLPDLVFQPLVDLKEIILSDNLLSELANNLFSFSDQLVSIFLDHNLLIGIDDTIFSKLKNLEVLDLSHNRIHQADFTNFYGKKLIMQQTGLKSVILSKYIEVFNGEGNKVNNLTLMEHENVTTRKYLMNYSALNKVLFYINEDQFVDTNDIEPMSSKLPEFIERMRNTGLVAKNKSCIVDSSLTKEMNGRRLMAVVCLPAFDQNNYQQNSYVQEVTTVDNDYESNESNEPTQAIYHIETTQETLKEQIDQTTEKIEKEESDEREFEKEQAEILK